MSFAFIQTILTGLAALVIVLAPFSTTIARQESVFLSQRSGQAKAADQTSSFLKPEEIREAEQRLSDLGYWTGPIDEVLDDGSRHAMIAFQKVEGRKRTGKLTRVG